MAKKTDNKAKTGDEVADTLSSKLEVTGGVEALADHFATAALKIATTEMPQDMDAVKRQVKQLIAASAAGNAEATRTLNEIRELLIKPPKAIQTFKGGLVDDDTATKISAYFDTKALFEKTETMTPELVRAAFKASNDVWQISQIVDEQFENDIIEILGDVRVVRGSALVVAEAGKVEKEWRENAMMGKESTVAQLAEVYALKNNLVLNQ